MCEQDKPPPRVLNMPLQACRTHRRHHGIGAYGHFIETPDASQHLKSAHSRVAFELQCPAMVSKSKHMGASCNQVSSTIVFFRWSPNLHTQPKVPAMVCAPLHFYGLRPRTISRKGCRTPQTKSKSVAVGGRRKPYPVQ